MSKQKREKLYTHQDGASKPSEKGQTLRDDFVRAMSDDKPRNAEEADQRFATAFKGAIDRFPDLAREFARSAISLNIYADMIDDLLKTCREISGDARYELDVSNYFKRQNTGELVKDLIRRKLIELDDPIVLAMGTLLG